MEKRPWSYRYYLLVAVGILLAGILVAGCGPASPPPDTITPPPGTLTPPPGEIVVVTLPPSRVRRELPEVWAGPGEEPVLPRLEDEDWHALLDGGLVTTDGNGEGWVDISQEDKKCMLIYIFQDSELRKAPCPKSDYTGRNVTCALAGTSVYNNSCAGEIIIQTPSAEIRLESTWVAVTYLPEQQLTVVMVFDADEEKVDKVTVWPVRQLDPRTLDEPPVEVVEEHFWFSTPGARADPVAGLEARVAHPFERLLPLVEALDLWAWIDRIKVRADDDNVPYPDFPPFGPMPTPTPTPPPMLTETPCEPPANWVVYVVQAHDTLFSLATKTRTTVEQVKRANCLVGDAIFVGQRLYLPFAPATPTPTPTPCGPPANWVLYTVQAKDTLFSLATKTRTTVEQIKRANCLVGDAIFVGQRLYLPFVPVPILTPTTTPTTLTPTATPTPTTPTPTPTPTPTTLTPTLTPTPTPTTLTPTLTPTPTPTLTPTPLTLLQVRRVQFLNAVGAVVHELTTRDLEAPPRLYYQTDINAIRVTFNKNPDHSTIQAGAFEDNPYTFSFLVQATWSSYELNYVPGSIQPESSQATRFVIHPEYRTFRPGDYTVTLFGDEDRFGLRPVITDEDGVRLDGEPWRLPSGNGTEGGNFVFEFTILREG